MNLTQLGWHPFFEERFGPYRDQGLAPARVAAEHRERFAVCAEHGELSAELCGRFRHEVRSRGDLPAVGDWVAIEARPEEGKATIRALVPRRSCFSRKEAGGATEEQVLAANVDTALLVAGLDGDFNVRRIERYLTMVWDSGADPVVVLNKADLCDDVEASIAEVEAVAIGVPVCAISAAERVGLEALAPHLGVGKTVVLVGSSGVGKSTLINAWLGAERQHTQEVRADDSRGRHTTTHRELIVLPGGGLVIDTPGMRELQLWGDEDMLEGAFADVEQLAAQCRFRDCQHTSEPGCAVKQAIEDGVLDPARWRSYEKLQRELSHLARRQDQKAQLAERAKWKKIKVQYRKQCKNDPTRGMR